MNKPEFCVRWFRMVVLLSSQIIRPSTPSTCSAKCRQNTQLSLERMVTVDLFEKKGNNLVYTEKNI